MNNQEVEEELFKLLQENKEKQVIVEGKRDKNILCLLGFKKILTLNKGIYETTEDLKENEVLLLTDFDNEGRQIARKLNSILQSQGYKIDRETRRKIGFMFTRLKIRKIEELRGVFHEQISSSYF
jgi:5S rRNA maturation endonuclease (ribonuclease M5)